MIDQVNYNPSDWLTNCPGSMHVMSCVHLYLDLKKVHGPRWNDLLEGYGFVSSETYFLFVLFEYIHNTRKKENTMKIKWYLKHCPDLKKKKTNDEQAREHLVIHAKQMKYLLVQWYAVGIPAHE